MVYMLSEGVNISRKNGGLNPGPSEYCLNALTIELLEPIGRGAVTCIQPLTLLASRTLPIPTVINLSLSLSPISNTMNIHYTIPKLSLVYMGLFRSRRGEAYNERVITVGLVFKRSCMGSIPSWVPFFRISLLSQKAFFS